MGLGQPEQGGIARMATLIKGLKGAGGDVLALNAGDVFVGTFEFNKCLGYPELKIMEGLYDVMALGNHEFDLGFDTLAAVLAGQVGTGGPVMMPVLCANVDFAGTFVEGLVQPSIVLTTAGGIRVGVFGLVTQDPQHYSADVLAGFSADLPVVAATQTAALREQGCDVVVCLSHLGAMYDIYGLSEVPGIDIIVGGHSHDLFVEPVTRNGKIIVQAGAFGRNLGELKVRIGSGGTVELESWTVHAVDGSVAEDPQVKAAVNAVRDAVVSDPRFGFVYTQSVGSAVQAVENAWPQSGPNRDTPLGNLVTDAVMAGLAKAGLQADFALEAMGYMSAGIPAGKIVGNDIMRAVPYGYDPVSGLGFKIVLVPLPPAVVLGGLEYTTSVVELTHDLCMQASGLAYAYDSSQPPSETLGSLSRLDPMSVRVGAEYVALSTREYYMVAMNEQVFGVLNGLMGGQLESYPTGLLEYNLVWDYVQSLRVIDYRSEGRVKDTAVAAGAETAVRRLAESTRLAIRGSGGRDRAPVGK